MLELYALASINPEGIGWWLAGWLKVGWSWGILGQSVLLALVVGTVSAMYPTYYATRLFPAEALRYE
jgi:ABC-type antimicrobial peptide transport system permease subunit